MDASFGLPITENRRHPGDPRPPPATTRVPVPHVKRGEPHVPVRTRLIMWSESVSLSKRLSRWTTAGVLAGSIRRSRRARSGARLRSVPGRLSVLSVYDVCEIGEGHAPRVDGSGLEGETGRLVTNWSCSAFESQTVITCKPA